LLFIFEKALAHKKPYKNRKGNRIFGVHLGTKKKRDILIKSRNLFLTISFYRTCQDIVIMFKIIGQGKYKTKKNKISVLNPILKHGNLNKAIDVNLHSFSNNVY
jgi:hypothetical protein